MDHSFRSIDRTTHLKIVAMALLSAKAVVGLTIHSLQLEGGVLRRQICDQGQAANDRKQLSRHRSLKAQENARHAKEEIRSQGHRGNVRPRAVVDCNRAQRRNLLSRVPHLA